MTRGRGRAGFTLVEVVVVLLILALGAAIAVPALLAPREDADIDAATRRIELLFQLARDSAVRGGVPIAVTIDSATGGVWLAPVHETDDGMYATTSPANLRPPGLLAAAAASLAGGAAGSAGAGEDIGLPGTVRLELTRARARFVFAPAGAAFGDSLLLRAGAAVRLVSLDPWTGHALVH
jgi:prepilin-type N-terminal cleavage/methylation domain-containing protein